MKRILVCFGTRPEAIKMAPVIHELQSQEVDHQVCVTAQHREMLDQVLDFFRIVPDYDLDLMSIDQSLNQLSSGIFAGMDEVLNKSQPDLILVHGDTSTSVIAAMAAFHRGIKIGHVEAGLRTNNLQSPFPEEMNRQVTGRLATYHFAPTKTAKENLLKENIPEEKIIVTENTIVDALVWGQQQIRGKSIEEIAQVTGLKPACFERFILVTGHRRENFGKGLQEICNALLKLSDHTNIVFPVHLNPNVRREVNGLLKEKENIHLIDPVAYPVMLWLIKNSEFIISDSGGIQEEAPSFGKKVLVTREFSERMEGVDSNFAVLVGTNAGKILEESKKLLRTPFISTGTNPYGNGKASREIIQFLKETLG